MKMTKKSCPYCKAVQDVQEIEHTEKIEYKGKNVIYKAVHYQCCKCNEVFDSAEMMDKNILSAKNAYELKYAKEIIKEFVDIANHYNKGFSPPLVSEELVKKAEEFIKE